MNKNTSFQEIILFTFLHPKEMATHSSTLAWKIPCTEEPGRQSPWGCIHFTSHPKMYLFIPALCMIKVPSWYKTKMNKY